MQFHDASIYLTSPYNSLTLVRAVVSSPEQGTGAEEAASAESYWICSTKGFWRIRINKTISFAS